MNHRTVLKNVIDELNKDISWEYAQAIQYIQHANMIKGPKYFSIIDELIIHGDESFNHAKTLSEIVAYLGGTPNVEVMPILTSADNTEMLQQDLMYEIKVMKRYQQRIEQLEALGLYDSAQKIKNITVTEQEHINELETILGVDKSIKETQDIYK